MAQLEKPSNPSDNSATRSDASLPAARAAAETPASPAGGAPAFAAPTPAQWEEAKMQMARLLGWREEPQAKTRKSRIADHVEEWMGVRRERQEARWKWIDAPERSARFKAHAPPPLWREPLLALWKALCGFALEEELAVEASPEHKAREWEETSATRRDFTLLGKPDGLRVVAPGHEERVLRAQNAVEEALAQGLPADRAYRLCATSVCQVAELAFWRSGARVQGGLEAIDSLMDVFYSADDEEPLWASAWACWDAQAIGRAGPWSADPAMDVCVAGRFFAERMTPWESEGEEEAGILASMDALWGASWMKMALAASRAELPGWEAWEGALWQAVVLSERGSQPEYWKYAAGKGVNPTLKNRDGHDAMDWLLEADIDQGSAGWFVLLSEKGARTLLEIAPDFPWASAQKDGKTRFDRALELVTAPTAREELDFLRGLVLARAEQAEIRQAAAGASAAGGEAKGEASGGNAPQAMARRTPRSL